jgi:hypothetical protein
MSQPILKESLWYHLSGNSKHYVCFVSAPISSSFLSMERSRVRNVTQCHNSISTAHNPLQSSQCNESFQRLQISDPAIRDLPGGTASVRFRRINNRNPSSLIQFVLWFDSHSSRHRGRLRSKQVENCDEQPYIMGIWGNIADLYQDLT